MNKIHLFGAVFNRAVINKKFSSFLCFLAGIIGSFPYYIESLFVCTFLSFFLLFRVVIIERKERHRFFKPFFWYFFGHYTLLYLFLSEMYPFSRFGFNSNQAVFILICSCFAIPLLHTVVVSSVMLFSKLFKNNLLSALGYASLFVIAEWILSLGFMAFPWGSVAVSLTGCLPYLQTISLFGKYFITFITVAGCYLLASSHFERKAKYAIYGAAIILFNLLVGTVIWFVPNQNSDKVDAAVIQGNVLSNEKWETGNSTVIYNKYIQLTEKAAQDGYSLIVLPESAIPITFTPGGKIHTALADIANRYNSTIICGVHYYDSTLKEFYNSVIAIYPDGSLSERYDKRHLVPFGEFIPFVDFIGKFLPFVSEFNDGTSDLTEGTEAVVIETEYGNVGPLVCFDSIFPQFAIEAVNENADYIAVVTNDSWFNDSAGIYTHLRHSQIRAIENKRYIVRAANTGISAIINERGQITVQTKPLTTATVGDTIYKIEVKTLYSLIGNIFIYISFAIILIIIIDFFKERIYGNHSTSSK